MLKNIYLFLVMLILIMFPMCSFASMEIFYDGALREYTGPEVTLLLNDIKFEVSKGLMPPIILENRTLVPVREVFETLGGKVEWYESEKAVEIELESKKVKLWIDKYTALVDGKEIELDVPAKIVSSKTMVPARFISEKCGLIVGWDDETKTVSINKELPIAQINSVEYKKVNGVNCVVVEANSEISGYKYFSLTEPDRLILDVENSKFVDETKAQDINDDIVSSMRFGKQENNINRIVLDLFKKLEDYIVVQSEDKKVLYLALDEKLELTEETKKDENVESENKTDENETKIEDNKETENNNQDENKTDNKQENQTDNKQDEPNKTDDNKQEDIKEDNTNENNQPELENPSEGEQENKEDNKEPEVEVIEYDAIINAIKYNSTSNRTRVMFDGEIEEYEEFFLENPKRLVIDIYNAKLELDGPNTITLKNKAIKEIEIAQYEKDIVRVVFDLSVGVEYKIKERDDELQIDIESPSYRNVEYKEFNNKAELTLYDVDIDDLEFKKNKSKNTYIISYSSSDFDTGSGTISTSDDYTKKIAITKTKITITDKGKTSYVTKQSGKNVIVTMTKANKTNDKIILLDAGHGGNDPGSHNGEYYEKDFNLSIMLKLKEMLEDADYTVYATREKDVTLTVNDRVGLATEDYPEAALYVSVHNNAVENKNYSGTLVMYCPRDTSEYGITNKQFASYVLEELVDELGTINRGFIVVKETDTSKRVLTEVPMPSILCEVAFVSNDEEVRRLDTEEFQESAALAIFNGIEKALEDME
ncbi:MAG: N-acetylmuramoyl-L-alanine amidase [Clostridia bacterium]|nr:N-acetylmuramoyl-L-alanine amidase [Clostridia bacterium]